MRNLEDLHKEDTGLVLSTPHMECSCLQKTSSEEVAWCGCEANKNKVNREQFTGSYSPPFRRSSDCLQSPLSYPDTGSYQDLKQLRNTYGKRTLESMEHSSNLANVFSNETPLQIGQESSTWQNEVELTQSWKKNQNSPYVTIGPLNKSKSISSLLHKISRARAEDGSPVHRELGNLFGSENNTEAISTSKPKTNGGMDTKARSSYFLMTSTPKYSDITSKSGLTPMPLPQKQKGEQYRSDQMYLLSPLTTKSKKSSMTH